MVYSFYFLFVGSRRNECNSLWGGIRGRGQKSTTYSENISVIKFYLSTLTLHLLWSIIFIFCVLAPEGMNAIVFLGKRRGRSRKIVAYSDTASAMLSMMIRWYRQLPLYTINIKAISLIFISDEDWLPPTDIASSRAHIFRVSGNLSDLFPLSLPKTIAFIPSGAKTQKKEIIPYPRCGFGACLRCGWAS